MTTATAKKKAGKKVTAKAQTTDETTLVIPAPNMQTIALKIVGTAPLMQHRFSEKARKAILDAQTEGSKSKNKKKKEPRDIQADYKAAMHMDSDGRQGIPASAFRNAMISACKICGFVMTRAKLSVFIEGDSIDAEDGIPLVYFRGEPELNQGHVRLDSGTTSIAIRPMWREWDATIRIRYDGDQFGAQDVANLLMRAGQQVGIGEGRPDSKKSNGMGLGLFVLADD